MPPAPADLAAIPGTTADRALGALYGVALGDAMGMPGELWPRRRILDHFGWIDRFLPGPDGHFVVDGFVAGQVTDDTQQTMMLADAILAGGGRARGVVVAEHLVAWADRVGATGGNFLGPSSERAIGLLRSGAPLEEAGVRGDTNGAAMRIVPVGVLVPSDDLDDLVDQVVECCRPSHFTDIAIGGAAMIAAAVSTAIDTGSVRDAVKAADRILDRAASHGNPAPGASLRRRLSMALSIVASDSDDDAVLQELYDVIGAGVATTEAVPTAVAIALMGGGDPVRTAVLCANLGGDTDTIGAMATGIAGAAGGFDAIPDELVATLESANDLSPLRDLALGLASHRTATSTS